MLSNQMYECRRCGRLAPVSEFIFVDVSIWSEYIRSVPGPKSHPEWRTWEYAMQAGCRACREADYLAIDPKFVTCPTD